MIEVVRTMNLPLLRSLLELPTLEMNLWETPVLLAMENEETLTVAVVEKSHASFSWVASSELPGVSRRRAAEGLKAILPAAMALYPDTIKLCALTTEPGLYQAAGFRREGVSRRSLAYEGEIMDQYYMGYCPPK